MVSSAEVWADEEARNVWVRMMNGAGWRGRTGRETGVRADFGYELPRAGQVRDEKDRIVSMAVLLQEGSANGPRLERSDRR